MYKDTETEKKMSQNFNAWKIEALFFGIIFELKNKQIVHSKQYISIVKNHLLTRYNRDNIKLFKTHKNKIYGSWQIS